MEATVRGAYQTGLGRTPVQDEIDYWVGLANSGLSDQEIVNAFQNAAQAELAGRGAPVEMTAAIDEPLAFQKQSATSDPETGWDEAILGAYSDILGRTPAQNEVDYWKGVARSGVTGNDLLNAFQNAAQGELNKRTYEDLVLDQYANIGRTDVGSELSNVDQEGLDWWVSQLESGALTPDSFESTFNSSVADFLVKNPENEYSQYVTDYLQENDPAFRVLQNFMKKHLVEKPILKGL